MGPTLTPVILSYGKYVFIYILQTSKGNTDLGRGGNQF